MSEFWFTQEHEWIRLEADKVGVLGISDYAQAQLGELVYLELPEPGTDFDRGAELAVIESVKAASELYAPLSLIVLAVNEAAIEDPSLVNSDPLGDGWLVKVEIVDPSELSDLMDTDAYQAFTDELD